jgi:signal transduction histidine kinase
MDSQTEITRLRDRISELERQKADMEDFVSVAAHELLTPVVMIDACAATVSDRLDQDERHAESLQDLDVLRRGCMHSRLLVESLLQHSVVRNRPVERRRVELGALVEECVALLGPELRARGARVVLGPLPAVRAEAPLIRSVFLNLLVNALKYGPRRDATVRIDAERQSPAWRFTVHSEGRPIPPGDVERIFEPRRRGRGERWARGGGLGLAVCRWIVERHGGEIGCAAEAGGNRFSFTLPA